MSNTRSENPRQLEPAAKSMTRFIVRATHLFHQGLGPSILAVTDRGTPPLTRHGRVTVTAIPARPAQPQNVRRFVQATMRGWPEKMTPRLAGIAGL